MMFTRTRQIPDEPFTASITLKQTEGYKSHHLIRKLSNVNEECKNNTGKMVRSLLKLGCKIQHNELRNLIILVKGNLIQNY